MPLHPVAQPVWVLTYQGRDITRELAPMVTSVSYTDHLHGQSDEMEVTLENIDGRWIAGWYPVQGDLIDLSLGYLGQPLLPCGQFRVDEVEASGPPDVVVIRALAAAITKDLRTVKTHAFEGMTLADIAADIAGRHGLRVVGRIAPVALERVTQADESDLAFLKRLAETYGYVFSVRETTLVFHQRADLSAQAAPLALARKDLQDYRLTDKTREIYQASEVSYQDPATRQTIAHRAEMPEMPTGDTLKCRVRAENPADAEHKANAALATANESKTTGSLTVFGDPRLVAGLTVELSGLGLLSGRYRVESSTHRQQRSGGYTTSAEIKRV